MEISMEQSCFYDKRFYGIQVLRGITALFIVLEHIRFLNCGAFGVDIFFCISGLCVFGRWSVSSESLGRVGSQKPLAGTEGALDGAGRTPRSIMLRSHWAC